MFKRKIAIAALSAAMALTLAAPVMAAPIDSGTATGNTDVQYTYDVNNPPVDPSNPEATVTDTFVWSVPSTQNFTNDNVKLTGQKVTIEPAGDAAKLILPVGGTVTIDVNSANSYKLWQMDGTSRKGTSEIDYDAYKDGDSENPFTEDDQVLQFVAGTSDVAGVEQGLTFETTLAKLAGATASGIHTDKLTFGMTTSGM